MLRILAQVKRVVQTNSVVKVIVSSHVQMSRVVRMSAVWMGSVKSILLRVVIVPTRPVLPNKSVLVEIVSQTHVTVCHVRKDVCV